MILDYMKLIAIIITIRLVFEIALYIDKYNKRGR